MPFRFLRRVVLFSLIVTALPGLSFAAQPAQAAEADAADGKWDIMVYNDGDRVRGHLLRRDGDVLVFQSPRFGELRVATSEAMIESSNPAVAPESPTAPAAPNTQVRANPAAGATAAKPVVPEISPVEDAGEQLHAWEYFYPSMLARQLRQFFGPWQGRFSFSTEIVSDTTDHTDLALDTTLHRKWTHDDVQLTGRYDYAETAKVPTTDLAKFNAAWRHDLTKRWFTTYNPAVEWNRISAPASADYLLVHQELGAGVTLLNVPNRQLRVGLSENRFDVWQTAMAGQHTSENAESAFAEATWHLPWRITLNERGVYYFKLDSEKNGWENHFQVDKKLTETLSIGVLHEVRYNNPDSRVTDYSRLKFMIGLDF
jgi:hypothetical protein